MNYVFEVQNIESKITRKINIFHMEKRKILYIDRNSKVFTINADTKRQIKVFFYFLFEMLQIQLSNKSRTARPISRY